MLALLALLACGPKTPPEAPAESPIDPAEAGLWHDSCGPQADGSRRFRILLLNDTYRIEGLADGRGGLARARTLRKTLESDCGPVGVMHAGDLLFPSLLSREFKGEQMIDVLNHLDGDPQAMDPYMVSTFGNHEFDKYKLKYAGMLDSRIEGSQFRWVDTNIDWKAGDDGEPLIGAENMGRTQLMELGGVKIGVFTVITDAKVPHYAAIRTDYAAIAEAQITALRDAGAEVVVALTHLDARVDSELLAALPADKRPDILLGGHNHVGLTLDVDGIPIVKGDADAVRVRVIEGALSAEGRIVWTLDGAGTALGPEAPPPDADVQAAVDAWFARYDAEFCGERGPGCLDTPLTTATTTLVAEELEIRRYETNLGDWVAGLALELFAEQGAQLAIINSGSLRINQDIPAGTTITHRHIEELFAYPAPMFLVEIKGSVVQELIDRSIQDWSGNGYFLQIAGFAYAHDIASGTASRPHLLTADGPAPIDPEVTYKLVVGDYLITPEMGDQDGYTMLSRELLVENPVNGTDLKDVVVEKLKAAGDAGIDLPLYGRICTSDRADGPCLLPE